MCHVMRAQWKHTSTHREHKASRKFRIGSVGSSPRHRHSRLGGRPKMVPPGAEFRGGRLILRAPGRPVAPSCRLNPEPTLRTSLAPDFGPRLCFPPHSPGTDMPRADIPALPKRRTRPRLRPSGTMELSGARRWLFSGSRLGTFGSGFSSARKRRAQNGRQRRAGGSQENAGQGLAASSRGIARPAAATHCGGDPRAGARDGVGVRGGAAWRGGRPATAGEARGQSRGAEGLGAMRRIARQAIAKRPSRRRREASTSARSAASTSAGSGG